MAAGIARALRAPRFITIAGLTLMTALAWLWIASGAGMPHGAQYSLFPFAADAGRSSQAMAQGMAMAVWSAHNILLSFAMWWVMMVAMMIPAAAPVVLLYDRSYRTSYGSATPPIWQFVSGYIVVWGVFSVFAAVAQIALSQAMLLSPEIMALEMDLLSPIVLIAAGIYQLTPAKQACLRHCRNPAIFIARHHSPGAAGAFRLGLIHGAYCLGCCWLLMLLLFVGGVMNLVWIAILTLAVAAEKLLPYGRKVSLALGAAFVMLGGSILFGIQV